MNFSPVAYRPLFSAFGNPAPAPQPREAETEHLRLSEYLNNQSPATSSAPAAADSVTIAPSSPTPASTADQV